MLRKLLIIVVSALVGIPVAGFLYLKFALPNVGPPEDIHIVATPEKLERGRYLANHVAVCLDCHSTRDWTKFSAPIIPGTEGKGGERFDEKMGLPGTLISRNLTPAGVGEWSDGELLRAFTTGVSRDGEPLFPLMPYLHFGKITREDAESILVYIRSLAPIPNEVPKHSLNFPMNLIVRTIPTPANFTTVDKTNSVEYGRYLVGMASCQECHTQMEKGAPLPGLEFAGGRAFPLPSGGVAHTANITPDKETGIGLWEKADFIKHFKSAKPDPIAEGAENTIMPILMFAGMTDEDLGSIFDYLRTLKPVRNKVEHFTK